MCVLCVPALLRLITQFSAFTYSLADEITPKQLRNSCHTHITLEDIHGFTTSLAARLTEQGSGCGEAGGLSSHLLSNKNLWGYLGQVFGHPKLPFCFFFVKWAESACLAGPL